MKKPIINNDLITRSFQNELTADQQDALMEWLEKDPANRDEYYRLMGLWDRSASPSAGRDAAMDEAWLELKSRILSKADKGRRFRAPWLRAAASVLLIAGLAAGSTWVLLKDRTTELSKVEAEPETPYIITPKGEKVILAADQTEIRYDQAAAGSPKEHSDIKPNREPQFLEMVVPRSRRMNLVLADGTRVWLNSESRFTYPEFFTENSRLVRLDGEAFFDVVHSERDTFVVQTGKVRVEVMGTRFNVTAYGTDGQMSATLVDGSVRVVENQTAASHTLNPGERALYDCESASMHVAQADTELYTSWINGYLKFDSESLDQVVRKLERNYSIPIRIVDPNLKQLKFSGKLGLLENIGQVMDVICLTAPLEYHESNGTILILNKKQ